VETRENFALKEFDTITALGDQRRCGGTCRPAADDNHVWIHKWGQTLFLRFS
jgi:hypothetical protein